MKPSGTTTQILLTKEQVGQLLGLSLSSVNRLIGRGEVQTVRIGRNRRVVAASVAALVADLMKKGGGDARSAAE